MGIHLQLITYLLSNWDSRIPLWRLSTVQDILEYNNITAHLLFEQLSPNCSEMFVRCRWKGENKPCDTLFERVVTNIGFCCGFNHFALKNHKFAGALSTKAPQYPRRTTSCGFRTGLEVLLRNEPDDYFASDVFSHGHKIFIHHPYENADKNTQHLWLGMATTTFIGIETVYTRSSAAVSQLDVSKRKCLLKNEKKLPSFRRYTYSNCLVECRKSIIQQNCGCVPFYFENLDSPSGNRICTLRDSFCTNQYMHIAKSSVPGFFNTSTDLEPDNYFPNIKNCGCYPNCEYCHYTPEQSISSLEGNYLNDSRFYGTAVIKGQSVFRVFFNDLVAPRNAIVLRYTWHKMFAFYGGILSLFTGFNFGSAFEVIYHFTVHFAIELYRLKRSRRFQSNFTS